MKHLGLAMALGASACASVEPQAALLRDAPAVSPVMTEHSAGLRCLGGLIEQSPAAPVSVVVRDIEDATVPLLNEERRLSLGGSFVLHTALSRLETSKVQIVMDEQRAGARRLTLSGAWTQDDLFTGERGVGVRVAGSNVRAGLGRRTSYDFIAGDFASSVNGRVRLSTAVGVALPRRGEEAFLVIDDGADGAEIGMDRRRVQGAQMAQRRVLEAVALVHLADFFGIDYRPCLDAPTASPEAFSAAIGAYERAAPGERHRMMQEELTRLGYLSEGPPSGRWDAQSRLALGRFQQDARLPPTSRPSAVLYALTRTHAAPPAARAP